MSFLILLFLSLCPKVYGETLYRSPETDPFVYEQYVLHNPIYTTPIEDFEKKSHTGEDSVKLFNEYRQAEQLFVSGTFMQAKPAFLKLVELTYSKDWPERDRQLIGEAYFRLAQISPLDEKVWLGKLAEFDIDFVPSKEKFPPNLIKNWRLAKTKIKPVKWHPMQWLSHFELAYLNGKPHYLNAQSFLALSAANNRLTFVSNANVPVTLIGSADQIMKRSVVTSPFISGNCHEPILDSQLFVKTALFPKNCLWQKGLKNIPGQIAESPKLNEQDKHQLSPNLFDKHALNNSALASPATGKSKWYKQKWLWVLLGGVSVAIIHDNMRGGGDNYVPSHKTTE